MNINDLIPLAYLLSPLALLFLLSFVGIHKVWPVFYVDHLDTAGKTSFGLWVRVRKSGSNPKATAEHERRHIKQRLQLFLFLHILFYKFIKKYRMWAEGQAYAVSWRNGLPLEECARRLCNPEYGLGLTQQEAERYIARQGA